MKKTLLAIGLLSSTVFSSLSAGSIYHRFSCAEARPTPDAAQSLSFYEVPNNVGSFVEYSYTNLAGAKKLIESMECDLSVLKGSIEENWVCLGQKYKIEIGYIGENEYQAYLYDLTKDQKSSQAKIFFCR